MMEGSGFGKQVFDQTIEQPSAVRATLRRFDHTLRVRHHPKDIAASTENTRDIASGPVYRLGIA